MKKTLSLIVIATLILLLCTGCSKNSKKNDAKTTSLSIVVANNESFPAISDVTVNSIYDEVVNVCVAGVNNPGTEVSLVVADGNPYIAFDEKIEAITVNCTEAKRLSTAESYAGQIVKTSASSPALTSEIDMLKALNIASSKVQSSDSENKRIIVYANGLQTTGILNMCEQNILDTNLDDLSDQLLSKNSIYNFEGIQFVWIGMGCVSADSNQVIPDSSKKKLENLWRCVIESGGGQVEFESEYVTGDSVSDTPTVSNVSFPEDTLENLSSNSFEAGLKLEGETLKFKGDLAEFVDKNKAKEILTPIAEQIIADNIRIIIIGSTASSGSLESCKELSIQRAEACKKLLISLGVESQNIEICGIGRTPCSLRVKDIDDDGNFVEEQAKQNRAIFLFNYDSQAAQDLLAIA